MNHVFLIRSYVEKILILHIIAGASLYYAIAALFSEAASSRSRSVDNKRTSPTTGVAIPVYTTVVESFSQKLLNRLRIF